MRIAVISETSAVDKNIDIMAALDGLGHEVVNVGMKKSGEQTELSYIHTGLMAAILLNAGTVDFVVGGCGTGQGFLNSVMQYPGVSCGLIRSPLDGWLFMQINGGNCISLGLNQGYGWAGEVDLKFIFEKLFSVERGFGYPPHRRDPQKQSRLLLEKLSKLTHKNMLEIIPLLPEDIISTVVNYPGFLPLIESSAKSDQTILSSLRKRSQRS
ncbi:MAG: RpiB/LacA/LacB family sugar-phosphate isomerase [Dehalococcoidia bacterium]|jgi:ribose 5-phosphate isomerase RpiB